ncbi:unnamed protein product [Miscanthus lutarioriparius]|uniref:DOG1 domain-containing protein n=1 Tax=Miscanthus lutarioriparius TaxID=422564 RepID=A0A811R7H8_9POAL|nr:unnamed protein product [Miscanthus lutarioriparius]
MALVASDRLQPLATSGAAPGRYVTSGPVGGGAMGIYERQRHLVAAGVWGEPFRPDADAVALPLPLPLAAVVPTVTVATTPAPLDVVEAEEVKFGKRLLQAQQDDVAPPVEEEAAPPSSDSFGHDDDARPRDKRGSPEEPATEEGQQRLSEERTLIACQANLLAFVPSELLRVHPESRDEPHEASAAGAGAHHGQAPAARRVRRGRRRSHTAAAGGAPVDPRVAAFELEYAHWVEEQSRQATELRAALQSHAPDVQLRVLVDAGLEHYGALFQAKGARAARSDAFFVLSGVWRAPAERFFLWIGGFRPSELLKVLAPQLDPLLELQAAEVRKLQNTARQLEDALTQGMNKLQQTLVETLMTVDVSPDGAAGGGGYAAQQMASAVGKLADLVDFVDKADHLRQQTLRNMHKILTPRQAARGCSRSRTTASGCARSARSGRRAGGSRRVEREMASLTGLNANPNPNKSFEILPNPGDSVSSLSFSPKNNLLVATSWDNQVRCWEIVGGNSQPKASISHDQPVLCSAWKDDGTTVFSGGCDKQVKMWPLLSGGQPQTVAMHDAPVKEVAWIPQMNLLVSGSWDKTLRYWDTRQANPVHIQQLPERCYALTVNYPLMIVGTADRHLVVFNLQNPQTEFKRIQSPLKYQTRCLAAFPDQQGFLPVKCAAPPPTTPCKVSLVWVVVRLGPSETGNMRIYGWRCGGACAAGNWEEERGLGASVAGRGDRCRWLDRSGRVDKVHHTFATAGSDGAFNYWDKDSKQRLKAFSRCPFPFLAVPSTVMVPYLLILRLLDPDAVMLDEMFRKNCYLCSYHRLRSWDILQRSGYAGIVYRGHTNNVSSVKVFFSQAFGGGLVSPDWTIISC